MKLRTLFPSSPVGLRGRAAELQTLARTIERTAPTRLALVGSGGSGKSVLAAALGHRVARRFRGGIHWFRVGRWDYHTLVEMMAVRFGTSRDREAIVPELRALLRDGGERLVVLDNHEDDRATARLLDTFATTPTTFVITARRCLLAGVLIFPVTAPLVTSGRSAFARVASLTRTLRWNPLALDIADALVAARAATATELAAALAANGVGRVHVIEHEDDLPEVAALVAWAWQRLPAPSRRMLGVLAHVEGDHMDAASLARLAGVRAGGKRALAQLHRWHLVQEPLPGRHALHAVVRHAVARWTKPSPARVFEYYVALLESDPRRMAIEQTHLFAAMDYAHRSGDLSSILRIERLLTHLENVAQAASTACSRVR
ncbi:MAG: hypothetical protein LC659_09175 [Myxococcales bacterium]|nr:hypothetical protein [Myxococcales bacterium]